MIRLGQYLPGDTVVHRLDPRVKILFVVALSILIFAATWAEILLISVFLAAVVVAAHITPAQTLGALRPVAVFMAIIFLVHLFFTKGRPILPLALLPDWITREGLLRGIYVTWQFAGLVLGAAVLTMTTTSSDLVGGIERLLRPLSRVGIPSQDLAVMIAMALRFMPILLEEYDRIRMAQMARGADFTTGNPALRMRAVAALALPLLLSAFRRADELAVAMEARGYRRGPRTTLRELAFSGCDLGAFAVMAVFFLANLAFRMAIR
ncbi:MAG: energy-coupling factor transporter transmembrane protein EcfT [Deltaproteobacteria bacterium]|nr:energy-coupling factor transporter transmembrane protein EcfT [Deltaproteobacteria bacterium]